MPPPVSGAGGHNGSVPTTLADAPGLTGPRAAGFCISNLWPLYDCAHMAKALRPGSWQLCLRLLEGRLHNLLVSFSGLLGPFGGFGARALPLTFGVTFLSPMKLA